MRPPQSASHPAGACIRVAVEASHSRAGGLPGEQQVAARGGDLLETRTGTAGLRIGDSVSASRDSSNVLEGAGCF